MKHRHPFVCWLQLMITRNLRSDRLEFYDSLNNSQSGFQGQNQPWLDNLYKQRWSEWIDGFDYLFEEK